MAVLPTTSALAATPSVLYVDGGNGSCSNTGPGSAGTPFCTISAAAAKAVAGQTVQVAAGTYREVVTVKNSGTASAPIVFAAAPGATVTGGTNGFKLSGRSYVTVRGFTVTGTSGDGILAKSSSYLTIAQNNVSAAGAPVKGQTARGITLNGTTNSTVSGNVTHDNSDDGLGVTSSSTGNVISGNESYGNARGYTRAAAGIRITGSPNNTVTANRLHTNEDAGLDLWNGSTSSLAVNNLAWDNGDHGIDVHKTNDAVVVANTIFRNYDSGIEMTGSLRTYLANNISADNGINSARTSGQIRADTTSAPSTVADYDLLWLSVPTTSKTVFLDWGGTKYTTLTAFTSKTGQETHGIQADPKFVNTGSTPPDLHLAAGSPAIDSGNNAATGEPSTDADGVARPVNGTVDRGAYESTGATGPTNKAPVVSAGPDVTVTLPNAATLAGSVTDDGLPAGSTLTAAWSQVSGPGSATFANAKAASTTATFSAAGSYVLRLTGSDGALQSTDDTTVTVQASATNQPPVVSAGPDVTVTLPNAATLAGSVSDDGLPAGSTLTAAWSQVSGPGTTTFVNAKAASTTATFSAAGSYVLRLTGSDGALQSTDDTTVTVQPASGGGTGSVLYVDGGNGSCSNTGSGSAAAPFCTISAAAAQVAAGQTVQVDAGTYSEAVSVTTSGTAGAPIVFTAAPGVTVTGGNNGFKLSGVSYVTVHGFTVTGTPGYGIYVKSSSHVTIDGNDISKSGQQVSGSTSRGITINGTTASVVSGNVTHDNTDDGIGVTGSSTGNVISGNESYGNARGISRAAAGIRITDSPNNTVTGNRLYGNEDSGLDVWNSSDGTLAVNNVVWDNGDHGIDVHSTNDAQVVANSVFRNADSGIEMTGSLRTHLANNISADNGINSARSSGQIRTDATSAPTTVADYDLLWLSVTPSNSSAFLDWGGTLYTSLAAFTTATGQESHGIQADPKFVNTGSTPPDLHLAAGSPAIDSGNNAAIGEPATDADGVNRPVNGTVDRGAYEFH